eukprot:TRINITY_DN76532_c0_g1_i1.p1 TRINITY_DN76532_c0_g1~~TRINITY_DN76532_c0_g1_i1.p1  ORF type:complete len:296 (+),score=27.47 TRINITY_DN76532_c0_g1_i1:152-1039(+)
MSSWTKIPANWEEVERGETAKFPPKEIIASKVTEVRTHLQQSNLLPIVDTNALGDDDLIERFLIQWNFDTKTAEEKMRAMIQWRATWNGWGSVNSVCQRPLPQEASWTRTLSGWAGVDMRGRPVFYDRLSGNQVNKCKGKLEVLLIAHVAHCEHLRQRMKQMAVTRVTNIIDLREIPISALAHIHFIQVLRGIASLTSDYYPETTATVFIANAPGPIQKAWNVLLGVIPERVKSKFVMLPAKDPITVLQNFIKPNCVPECLGGTAKLQPLGDLPPERGVAKSVLEGQKEIEIMSI